VRGVGSGGIVSSAVSIIHHSHIISYFNKILFVSPQFCLLYKLYTLKLTRKQLNGLLKHSDSPYIRALGFMYIRFTQPPTDLFDWYEEFLQDEEEIDVKAGGGHTLTMGQMCRQFLTKLDWFSTLFPRIPVPAQKSIEQKLNEYDRENGIVAQPVAIHAQQQQQQQHQSDRRNRERFERNDREERPQSNYQRNDKRRSKTPERRHRGEYEDEARNSGRDKYSSSKSTKYYRDRSRSRSKERKEKDRRRYDYNDEARNSRRY
jgi:pre-mRNA-splicing factor 38B